MEHYGTLGAILISTLPGIKILLIAAEVKFYLHGDVETVKGDNTINDPVPQYRPYQYSRILDTLRAYGFNVISERRLVDVDGALYVLMQ